jgi:hypothetical protein
MWLGLNGLVLPAFASAGWAAPPELRVSRIRTTAYAPTTNTTTRSMGNPRPFGYSEHYVPPAPPAAPPALRFDRRLGLLSRISYKGLRPC